MEYGQTAAASASAQPTGRNAPAVEQRSLEAACERLEKHLAAMADGVSRINQFSQRLLNPRPQGVGKDSSALPKPGTIEGRLQHILHVAEGITNALHEVANELERAA